MSVTSPHGFRASGVAAGIKPSGAMDLALVVNDGPLFAAAGVFTRNRVFAAPVGYTRSVVADGELRAIVLNSGGANACTGEAGLRDAEATADAVADALSLEPTDVGVCSTGLIGVRLPMAKVLDGVRQAAEALSQQGGSDAARAIMTTDTRPKTATRQGQGYSIGGMAKGAGMLAPGLATMLVVVTTDAVVAADQLDQALRDACSRTFDRVDSDGCMSTNDTVVAMANGASGVQPDLASFTALMTELCEDLARQLIGDAEGAEHDVAVCVRGAASEADALEVARAVARSNLVKTAIFGRDPNWGRVVSEVGTTQASFDPQDIDVSFNGVTVFRQGGIGEDRSLVDLSGREVRLDIDLHAGDQQATIWTNDLTYGYVKENAEYSS